MLEPTGIDYFKNTLQKLDMKTVEFLIEELERNEIDTETKYLFSTIALQCLERHPYSIRDQLFQAIKKECRESFKQIMPVKIDSLH